MKNRNGTYIVRHKVAERLREPVSRVLGKGKQRQVWLQRSRGAPRSIWNRGSADREAPPCTVGRQATAGP